MSKEWEGRSERSVRRLDREEERVWVEFYRCAGDPAVAAELVAHLDQDEQVRRQHSVPALPPVAAAEKERRQRAQASGRALRKLAWALIGWPLAALHSRAGSPSQERACGAIVATPAP